SHACTFCIIPYRRGVERSRTREDILREVQKLTDQGVREVMLLGQIVDRYGCDFEEPYDLADLLADVAQNENLLRIRYLTGHPNYMTDKLIKAVRDIPKVCPHFEVPVQAGNDKVLEDMRRGYTAQEYREVVARIRAVLPDAAINTDIIVGFPGETDDEFMDTYALLKELELDKVHLAKYSERPKTIAARQMPDDVSEDEKEQRRLKIDELTEEILARRNLRYQDQVVEVLVESKAKEKWRGRTPDNRLVFFHDDRHLLGALVNVTVTQTGPWSLQADQAEIVIPPHALAEPVEAIPS
ncbi:MAG: tRNA-2-methylthio-N6-dimethylallyladenosine synthase, partial [Candidatus Omnitrophota bacterium]